MYEILMSDPRFILIAQPSHYEIPTKAVFLQNMTISWLLASMVTARNCYKLLGIRSSVATTIMHLYIYWMTFRMKNCGNVDMVVCTRILV